MNCYAIDEFVTQNICNVKDLINNNKKSKNKETDINFMGSYFNNSFISIRTATKPRIFF